jgi:diguanylate cyclase (GGDEF)-like protein/PAS domain S-box-containing protein
MIGAIRHWIVFATGLLGLALLLTWLFVRADAVSPHAHYRYLASLRSLQQADVELNAAVLASRAGLLLNYDAIARHLEAIRTHVRAIDELPDFLPAPRRPALVAMAREIDELQKRKEERVDAFRRGNAVLRNSADYFPRAIEEFMRTLPPDSRPHVELGGYFRGVLDLGRDTQPRVVAELRTLTERLAVMPLPPASRRALDHLLVHGRVILERHPEIADLTREILQLPTAELNERLTRLYTAAHEDAQDIAAVYRLFLYAVALLLIVHVVWAYLRIERDQRELAAAHRALVERYEAQRATEERLRLFATVFSSATEGMTITDAANRIVAVNPAFTQITGYAEHEALGQTPALLNSGRHDRDYYRQMWAELQGTGKWRGEIWNRRKDGATYPEWLSITAVRDDAGRATHFIGIFSDITERKETEARIQHLAHHDALTGLPNRLLLDDRVEQALLKSKRSAKTTAILFLNLDRFKNINETLGHEIGDELLVQAAKRGATALRETDTLARHGGDAFIAVLPELDQPQDATLIARKLMQSFAAPYRLAGHDLTVTASIGIALGPGDGENASDLLRNAETAMYRAKQEGRNTFRYYSADMNFASLGELLLEAHLRSALDRGELLMHYQPKIDAASGALIGAEALMRWQHPEHGTIPPARFIPLAEECGLIPALGAWALHSVCRQLREWLDAGLAPVPVAVNVSAAQFAQQDVPATVAAALAASALPAELLELELTESLLMHDTELTAAALDKLNGMGVRMSIDDFGTGYSSLSYLRRFPVQTLKIDRAFVKDIDASGEPVKLAAAIIALAHGMNLRVVAEGVETEAQRDYLAGHGCDEFQGFLFAQPLPVDDFAGRLADPCARGLSPSPGAAGRIFNGN